jgi:hypothetical protein
MAKRPYEQSVERGVHAASTSPARRTAKRDESRTPDGGRLPRPLLDTRAVCCGDNLEQPGQMQKEECRMMKPARLQFHHSSFCVLPLPVTGSFYYRCDWHASHYVKVMLDQIFGYCKCNCA